jgi:hypothetical protein
MILLPENMDCRKSYLFFSEKEWPHIHELHLPMSSFHPYLLLQHANVEGLAMYVSNRKQITTYNGLCPIRRITMRDNTGAHRVFGLWRDFANTSAVVLAKPGATVIVITDVVYNLDHGYLTSKTRYACCTQNPKSLLHSLSPFLSHLLRIPDHMFRIY